MAHGRGTSFAVRSVVHGTSERSYAPGRGATGVATMNEQEFQSKLAELMGEISTLPATERRSSSSWPTKPAQRHERLRQTVSSLQESLDYLRLSIKYLVFDLEATRRENGYLRKMLEETSGGGADSRPKSEIRSTGASAKPEIRSTKSETNSKPQRRNDRNGHRAFARDAFRHFFFSVSERLFRISCFGFRFHPAETLLNRRSIWLPGYTPPPASPWPRFLRRQARPSSLPAS